MEITVAIERDKYSINDLCIMRVGRLMEIEICSFIENFNLNNTFCADAL